MNDIELLTQRIDRLESIIFALVGSDRYTIMKTLSLGEGRNIQLGKNTGTKIGTEITQKISFHNSTPVVQRSGAAQAAVSTTASTQSTPYGYTTSAQADAIVTLLNEIRAALVEKGIIKGSA